MFILVNPHTSEVVDFAEFGEVTEIGIMLHKGDSRNLYIDKSFVLSEVTEINFDFVPTKYLYSEQNGYVLNPNYIEPQTIEQKVSEQEQRIIDLELQIAQMLSQGGTA